MGVITGMLVTAVIQSSTVTIVLATISAGIILNLNRRQHCYGANEPRSKSAQIIRLRILIQPAVLNGIFKPSTLAPIALIYRRDSHHVCKKQ